MEELIVATANNDSLSFTLSGNSMNRKFYFFKLYNEYVKRITKREREKKNTTTINKWKRIMLLFMMKSFWLNHITRETNKQYIYNKISTSFVVAIIILFFFERLNNYLYLKKKKKKIRNNFISSYSLYFSIEIIISSFAI